MNHGYFRTTSLGGALIVLIALLGGCGSMPSMPSMPSLPNVWPFGEKSGERSRVPPGATAYQCDNGRTLYVRYLETGKAAWVILPEREFRLNALTAASAAAAGARYSNGIGTLETKGNEATLSDGATVTHANCKAAAPPA